MFSWQADADVAFRSGIADPRDPPKPKNAYMRFQDDNRGKVKAELVKEMKGEKVGLSEISKRLGSLWKEATDGPIQHHIEQIITLEVLILSLAPAFDRFCEGEVSSCSRQLVEGHRHNPAK